VQCPYYENKGFFWHECNVTKKEIPVSQVNKFCDAFFSNYEMCPNYKKANKGTGLFGLF